MPLIPPDQFRQEDLDFLQGEVEANAHSRTSGEGNVRSLGKIFDFVSRPPVRIEFCRVLPVFGVVVNVVDGAFKKSILLVHDHR